jgi:hypothetical protein
MLAVHQGISRGTLEAGKGRLAGTLAAAFEPHTRPEKNCNKI